ncbi:MAG TPA: hypothetical protein VJ372_01855, partial [Pyrinomonadaceae bacterium]|nr:hypothetical protein [Pyrinomonadaceae bacterium]
WQPLQLNLPRASVRDLVIHGDDLIVATHGRGFWVIDNITALRQIDSQAANSNVVLFKPAVAINVVPPSDNGTPQPRDEPLAENPPFGAMIDYYLKNTTSGSVVLEILDPSGDSIRRYSSDEKPTPVDPDTQNIPAFWRPTPQPLSGAAGMHRWVWDLRPTPPAARTGGGQGGGGGGGGIFGGGRPTVLSGRYTVKLTVGGETLTQALIVEPDPRVK